MIVSIRQVSQNNEFSRYICITYRYPDPFRPLLHNRHRHRPFLHINKLAHLYSKMLIEVLDDFGGEGEKELGEEGVEGSSEAIISFGRLVTSLENDLAR